jgi:hypothetical protein
MLKERQYQAELADVDLSEEARRAVDYCNAQLLRPERHADWKALRTSRKIHIRQGSRMAVELPTFEEDE